MRRHFDGQLEDAKMRFTHWAFALMLTMVVGNVSVAVAADWEADADGDGMIDIDDEVGGRVLAGSLTNDDGTETGYAECYLSRLRAHESPHACGNPPKGFSWHDASLQVELMRTPWRVDSLNRPVYTGTFGGVWNGKRFEQAEDGMYGYEGGKVYKDNRFVGRTGILGPPFWSSQLIKLDVSKRDISDLRTLIANLEKAIKASADADTKQATTAVSTLKNAYEQAKAELATLEKLAGDHAHMLAKSNGASLIANEAKDAVEELTGKDGTVTVLRSDVDGLMLRREQNRFYVELGVIGHFENWQGDLPGGLTLDIRPTLRGTLGFGLEFRGPRLTLRGVGFGGLHTGKGFTAGARVDAFYAFDPAISWVRFGGSLGVSVDWYHVLPDRSTPAGVVYSTSLGLRVNVDLGIAFEIPGAPVTFTLLGGVAPGITWVGIKGRDVPYRRAGGRASLLVGFSF